MRHTHENLWNDTGNHYKQTLEGKQAKQNHHSPSGQQISASQSCSPHADRQAESQTDLLNEIRYPETNEDSSLLSESDAERDYTPERELAKDNFCFEAKNNKCKIRTTKSLPLMHDIFRASDCVSFQDVPHKKTAKITRDELDALTSNHTGIHNSLSRTSGVAMPHGSKVASMESANPKQRRAFFHRGHSLSGQQEAIQSKVEGSSPKTSSPCIRPKSAEFHLDVHSVRKHDIAGCFKRGHTRSPSDGDQEVLLDSENETTPEKILSPPFSPKATSFLQKVFNLKKSPVKERKSSERTHLNCSSPRKQTQTDTVKSLNVSVKVKKSYDSVSPRSVCATPPLAIFSSDEDISSAPTTPCHKYQSGDKRQSFPPCTPKISRPIPTKQLEDELQMLLLAPPKSLRYIDDDQTDLLETNNNNINRKQSSNAVNNNLGEDLPRDIHHLVSPRRVKQGGARSRHHTLGSVEIYNVMKQFNNTGTVATSSPSCQPHISSSSSSYSRVTNMTTYSKPEIRQSKHYIEDRCSTNYQLGKQNSTSTTVTSTRTSKLNTGYYLGESSKPECKRDVVLRTERPTSVIITPPDSRPRSIAVSCPAKHYSSLDQSSTGKVSERGGWLRHSWGMKHSSSPCKQDFDRVPLVSGEEMASVDSGIQQDGVQSSSESLKVSSFYIYIYCGL